MPGGAVHRGPAERFRATRFSTPVPHWPRSSIVEALASRTMSPAAIGKRTRAGHDRPRLHALGIAGSVVLLTATRALWAQPEPSTQRSATDESAELFREGRQL